MYEIDYKQFFDRVNLLEIYSQMVRIGFPIRFADFMLQINKFPIDLEFMKLNEMQAISKLMDYITRNPDFKFRKTSGLTRRIVKEHGGVARCGMSAYTVYSIINKVATARDGGEYITLTDVIDSMFDMPESYSIYGIAKANLGVPQGAPTSCSLATLALRTIEERVKDQGLEMVAYADDVIIAGKTEFDPSSVLEDESIGLTIN